MPAGAAIPVRRDGVVTTGRLYRPVMADYPYLDIDAKYHTGTPASDRLVAETRSLKPRREAINKANGVVTRHLQSFDGGPCACGWPANGLPYAPSHQAHVAERLWDAGCLAGG